MATSVVAVIYVITHVFTEVFLAQALNTAIVVFTGAKCLLLSFVLNLLGELEWRTISEPAIAEEIEGV